jgi:hypothetical protein
MRAVYPTVRKIAALDKLHSAEELARQVFLSLPGLYQLLPENTAEGEIDLFDVSNWPTDLPPNPKLLAHARQVRARLPDADKRCFVVAGTQQETTTAARLSHDAFTYEIRPQGDGTVPLSRALWAGARTWYAAENHGALSSNSAVLAALIEILREGDTERLSAAPPEVLDGVRFKSDRELRAHAVNKVEWDLLSLNSRRRILEPILTPEFVTPES